MSDHSSHEPRAHSSHRLVHRVQRRLLLTRAARLSGGSSPYQYYRFFNTERREGASEVHSFDLEYAALTALHRDGYITLCTSQSREDCGAQKASGVRSLPHA